MKIIQVVNGWCYNDMTPQFPTLADTAGRFAPDVVIVEAPDKVFEGWGYDETKEGDERFIQPTPPEGWLYDEGSGTFYQEGTTAPSQIPPTEVRVNALESENKLLKEQISAQSDQLDFYEECIAEMASIVYA